MYGGYDGYGAVAAVGGFMTFFMLGFLVCVIIAYVFSLGLIVRVAKESGFQDVTGKLIFIGIFLTPILSGICLILLRMKQTEAPTYPAFSQGQPRQQNFGGMQR